MRAAFAVVVAGALVLPPLCLHAQSNCVSYSYSPNTATTLGLNVGNGVSVSQVNAAVGMWDDCGGYGTGFPSFAVNQSGDLNFNIQHAAQAPAGVGCGNFVPTGSGTTITGGTITIYDKASNGVACSSVWPQTIAHELGHTLGLANSTCAGYIMALPTATSTVKSAECTASDERWTVPPPPPPPPPDEIQHNGSPIILDLGHDGYRLTSVAAGVHFDLRNEGRMLRVAWTRSSAETAFLVLDRNANGQVDSGAELFGNFTLLRSGVPAQNGFQALSELDENHDGAIDPRDETWFALLLWVDRDHNGSSTDDELQAIATSSVTALETTCHLVGRRDEFGNELRYMSHFRIRRGAAEARWIYYDVFLQYEP